MVLEKTGLSVVLPAEQIVQRCLVHLWKRVASGSMLRAETAHITIDGIEYDVVLHVYGERDWRGFMIKPGSQVRIPERGASKEEVLEKLAAALKDRLGRT